MPHIALSRRGGSVDENRDINDTTLLSSVRGTYFKIAK